ncbi:tryptophanyl-tRNA synthetase [compost metagenome]
MRANYLGGNYGYGHAKQALFELITEKFKAEREKYNYYINNLEEVDSLLKKGASKAAVVADGVLARVREVLGFGK